MEIVTNVKLYELCESLVAAGYPMATDTTHFKKNVKNLEYWLSYGDFLPKFIKYQKTYGKELGKNTETSCKKCGREETVRKHGSDYYCGKHHKQMRTYGETFETTPKYTLKDGFVEVEITGDERKKTTIKIDERDLPFFFENEWCFCNYCYSQKVGLFHRIILNGIGEDEVVDHINRDKTDNRRCNLRVCANRENVINSSVSKNNTTGFVGVSYRKQRNKWRAYIMVNRKQINLGHFETKEDALKSRLNAEKEMFGVYAPQRHLFEKYGVEPIVEEEEKGSTFSLQQAIKDLSRGMNLGTTEKGSGHDQALSSVVVAFDLTFTNKAWVEMERYKFVTFTSSQSTMHRIAKFDLEGQCCEYVDELVINRINQLKDEYNANPTTENYLKLLYNIPSGFKLTARLTTNYRALKTIYAQRKNHKLPEWREFCKWVESLPLFLELTQNKKAE